MNIDEEKTKEQMMNELVELRQRITELEASEIALSGQGLVTSQWIPQGLEHVPFVGDDMLGS